VNGGRAALVGLGRAGNPGRTLAFGVAATVAAVKAGNTAVTVLALVLAVMSGQLLAGWAQDRLYFAEDRRAGRANKPLVAGAVSLGAVEIAMFASFVVTVFASLLLGWRAGLVQLATVGCTFAGGWHRSATNTGWPLSVAAAALLPAVATLALPAPAWPARWAVIAGALFGAAVAATDAIGAAAEQMPLRAEIGAAPRSTPLTRVPWPHGILVPGAALLLVGAAAVLGFAATHAPDPITVIGAVAAMVLTGAGARELWYEPDTRATFFLVITLGPVFLAMVISAGGTLH
jgi:hypothetical protein